MSNQYGRGTDQEWRKKPSTSDEKPATDDERLYVRVQLRAYEKPGMRRYVDEFGVTAWLTKRHFQQLKEYFLEAVRVSHMEMVE